MAVQEQTPLREYTANGVTTSFALGFDCEETNHLIVTIDDVEVLPTDWYLSGSNVIFWNAPGNGKLIKLQRNTPFNRLADYQSYNNSFRPPAINKEFDRIWWKLQELGVADWILHNRIDALKAYVDQQDSELQQNIDNLKIYVDDKDDELRAYLLEEIQKQGVALDQLDEYYNYLMQRLAQIAIDKGWEASFVVDKSGKTQQELNDSLKVRLNNVLYASDFKITGNGSDESDKVQQMFNLATGKTLDFENKTVWCSKQVQLVNKRKFSLQNGLLKALASSRTDIENRVLFLNQCSNFTTVNFDADGNRQERTPDEKAIHTVTMRSCKKFMVINANWVNGVCDNLHFDCLNPTALDKSTHTQNGWFINCEFDNAFRNNLSCIVGRKIKFTNCKFTRANGALPMAGVDIESNRYGGDGLSDDITFDNCTMSGNIGWQFMSTHHDAPRNIILTNCKISAPDVSMYGLLDNRLVAAGTVGATTLPDVSNTGGVQVANPDTTLINCTLLNFPLGSGTAMRVGAEANAYAKLLGCKFFDIHNEGFYTVQAHGLSDGIYLSERCQFINTTDVLLGGKISEFYKSNMDNCGLISSLTSSGKVIIDRISAKNGKSSRYILLESPNGEVLDCHLSDLRGESIRAYIEVGAVGAVIKNNICQATTQQEVVGIRFDAAQAKEVSGNECINLHSTAPYFILNPTVMNIARIFGNKGGTSNIDTPVSIRGYSTLNRPLPNTVPRYSSIYDSTLKKVITSDGANWYDQAGTLLT